ncbi:hypothetical protein [Aeromonas veronii]
MKRLKIKKTLILIFFLGGGGALLYPFINAFGCNAKFHMESHPLGQSLLGSCELGVMSGTIETYDGGGDIEFKGRLAVWGRQHYLFMDYISLKAKGDTRDNDFFSVKNKLTIFSKVPSTYKHLYSWRAFNINEKEYGVGGKNILIVTSEPMPALFHLTLHGNLSYMN